MFRLLVTVFAVIVAFGYIWAVAVIPGVVLGMLLPERWQGGWLVMMRLVGYYLLSSLVVVVIYSSATSLAGVIWFGFLAALACAHTAATGVIQKHNDAIREGNYELAVMSREEFRLVWVLPAMVIVGMLWPVPAQTHATDLLLRLLSWAHGFTPVRWFLYAVGFFGMIDFLVRGGMLLLIMLPKRSQTKPTPAS